MPSHILFGLLRGCDFNGLAPFMSAVNSNKDKIQIIGFVQKGWLTRNPSDPPEAQKVYEDFSQKDLKVLGVLYNDKHKEKCEYQLYNPSDIRLVSDNAPTHQNQQLSKNQFQISSAILDRLFEDSDLLSSIDEDDIGQKQLDIFQLNTRTMIMKMINHQLQSNSQNFLNQLKGSNFYQALLKFVCRESSIEMKGDIMLLEWLEQRCFAIRKYACENQQSLVKQREVHITLVKDKLYVSFQHPVLKGQKQLNAIPLLSAVNYKNFEEKKEVKLIHSQDVFISQGDQINKAEQQIVLIDPESLARNNGLDIINAGIGAITYGVDLNKTIKNIFIKQRENRDKYIELAQKTIFLVTEEEFRKILTITKSNTFKRATTMKQQPQQEQVDEDNFDNVFVQELINYGGINPKVAKKTLEKDTIEGKTETLVQIQKQIKEGLFELDDGQDQPEDKEKVKEEDQENKDLANQQSNTPSEERSEALVYLKNSFHHYMERTHPDAHEKSSKDALFDTINSFSKKDLAADYEKSMIRLFNMYCRHVFWSLIQKDDIHNLFSMVLETETEMKSFSVFLKVLGNECFITGNKVYIKSFKIFLKKVVHICCKVAKFRPLLEILVQEGIINAYQVHMEELKTDQTGYSNKRIEEYFKTETKASQLMNPFIVVPLLKHILHENADILLGNIDRLVSTLVSLNCLFIGNYTLKEQIWVLVISILEKVRQNIDKIPQEKVKKLLQLKVIEYIFSNFQEVKDIDREEVEYVKRQLRENTSGDIDGISRRDAEKLVYARRAICLSGYKKYHNRESAQILIEMMYKFYLIDRKLEESQFLYKNKQGNRSNRIYLQFDDKHGSLFTNNQRRKRWEAQ
ncbi:UNKNOWN [Stylonychia lemnae]|uniref:Uncharacterized protein n=1 Tax=Stylonychia lemnae TaxID=5949 RepID=A0A077ZNI6_STYLE|nr:UNKNOWN [Stylonychia lemnae]|eukprot:CDW71537.1 UNKNOWN [Stylonychia lemnae]